MITITHNRTEGTLVYGTTKGDGAGKILRANRFRPSRHLPDGAYWYLVHSLDRRANRRLIEEAAGRLREAGFEVAVEIDDTTRSAVPFAEREAERYQYAQERADRYAERAERAGAAGEQMWQQVADQRAQIPPGQPMMPDHHSYAADRNRRERWHRKEGRAIDEIRRGRYWAQRADAAERHQQHRQNIPTTLRRIDRLQAHERRLLRELAGHEEWVPSAGQPELASQRLTELAQRGVQARRVRTDPQRGVLIHIPVSERRRAQIEADLTQVRQELDHWRQHVAQAEAEGVKIWRPQDFAKGDFVRNYRGGCWMEIIRVNPKSLTVPWAHMGIGHEILTVADVKASGRGIRVNGKIYTDTLPYDKVIEHLPAQQARTRWPDRFASPAASDPPAALPEDGVDDRPSSGGGHERQA